MTAIERRKAIQHLVDQYETELGSILDTSEKFETHRLPQHIQDILEIVVAKTPSFSNIAALATVNYSISHILGQTRAEIDDLVYSHDRIGINTYTVVISGSGSGKSSSTNHTLKLFKPAIELIEAKRRESEIKRAIAIALKEAQKEEARITEDQITPDQYEQYMKPLLRTVVKGDSTRGGISTLLAKLQAEEFSSLSVIYDEFGMSLKSGGTVPEVMQLLTEAFDLGMSEAPEFKGEDVKEVAVEGMYTNVLAHSSPKIIFSNPTVSDQLSLLYSTSLARRTILIFPDPDETVENNYVPPTTQEDRELQESRRVAVAHKSPDVSDAMTVAVQRLLDDPANRLITFTHDAANLYADYFSYCNKRAELLDDASIVQIEMSGRAFKLGKLLGIWAIAGNSSTITKELVEAVIYLGEYASKYLEKFVRLTTAELHKLLADLFRKGQTEITLDAAITANFVKKVTPGFKELMDPLNSVLRDEGVCTYNRETKIFSYEKFTKVVQNTNEDNKNCSFAASFKMVPGMPKAEREFHLNAFDKYKTDLCFNNLKNLVTKDTIYSAFHYKEADNTPHNRAQANIISNTNLVIIDIDKSDVPMDTVSEFLENYQHLITTTSNKENRNKFRLLLPINVELDGTNTKQYGYIVKRIATDLLVEMDPVSKNPAQPYYGYEGSDTIIKEEGALYDITHFLTEYAAGDELKPLRSIPKKRTSRARKSHIDSIMDNVNQIFEYAILADYGEGSHELARACLHLVDEGATAEELAVIINYINSRWDNPMEQERLQRTLIEPYQLKCQKETK